MLLFDMIVNIRRHNDCLDVSL